MGRASQESPESPPENLRQGPATIEHHLGHPWHLLPAAFCVERWRILLVPASRLESIPLSLKLFVALFHFFLVFFFAFFWRTKRNPRFFEGGRKKNRWSAPPIPFHGRNDRRPRRLSFGGKEAKEKNRMFHHGHGETKKVFQKKKKRIKRNSIVPLPIIWVCLTKKYWKILALLKN